MGNGGYSVEVPDYRRSIERKGVRASNLEVMTETQREPLHRYRT
jgi:hypothetical protein